MTFPTFLPRISPLLATLLLAGTVLGACGDTPTATPAAGGTTALAQLTPMKLALEWVPNSSHAGVYTALQKGWYREQGIDLQIVPFGKVFPDTLVNTGQVEVGISTTDNVVQDAISGQSVVSIGAVYQHNVSAIVTMKDRGYTRPSDLDNKIYGGYGAPYDQPVVSSILKKDGGQGAFKYVKLGVGALQALSQHQVDFVWVFQLDLLALQVEQPNLKDAFNIFPITSYGLPDYYTPVFITGQTQLQKQPELLRKFMAATAKGYDYASSHQSEAVTALVTGARDFSLNAEAITASQGYSSPLFKTESNPWGQQKPQIWQNYVQFMLDSHTLKDASGSEISTLDSTTLFNNAFLPQ